jgi:hypothetical protein
MAGASALSLATLAGIVAATVPISDAEMRAGTDRLLAEVAAVRRLHARGTLERHLETRAEANARRLPRVTGSELEARARLWRTMGLLHADAAEGADVGPAAEALSATASYDSLQRRLFVPDWIPLPEQRTALAHALAHALADQRFGLRDVLKIDLEGRHHLDGDAERARAALIEGDASLAALELDDPRGALTGGHALPALEAALGVAPATARPWSRVNASFAHADGLAFVARVRARKPWSAVDALWADPPQSSEQILHPEKYDARERPVALPPLKPRALGDAWLPAASDVLGELGARTWLEAFVSEELAARAAAGWGGDRAVLLAPSAPESRDAGAAAPADFVAWWTAWDDVTDAQDFADEATVVLAGLAGAPAASDGGRVVARRGDAVFALARRGALVGLLLGAPQSALPALDQGLEALKVPARAPARPRVAAPPSRSGGKTP